MAKQQQRERRTVRIPNTDEAIGRRIRWMTSRGWELVLMETAGTNPLRARELLRFKRST